MSLRNEHKGSKLAGVSMCADTGEWHINLIDGMGAVFPVWSVEFITRAEAESFAADQGWIR